PRTSFTPDPLSEEDISIHPPGNRQTFAGLHTVLVADISALEVAYRNSMRNKYLCATNSLLFPVNYLIVIKPPPSVHAIMVEIRQSCWRGEKARVISSSVSIGNDCAWDVKHQWVNPQHDNWGAGRVY